MAKMMAALVLAGTLAGAVLGSEVGKSLDRADRLAMERSTQNALENNKTGKESVMLFFTLSG